MLKFLKKGAVDVFWGLVATAIATFVVAPNAEVDLGNWGLVLLSVPLFMVVMLSAGAIMSLYALVSLIELIGVKLGLLDMVDLGGGL